MAQPPDYCLFFTDGDPTHLPSTSEREKDYETTDDYGLTQKALSNFATEMMRNQNKKIEKGQTYTKIPDGYSVWPCQRGGHKDIEKPKIDWYIFGHPNHKKFDSFAQFAMHINFLQTQPPQGGRTCKVCTRHPITASHVVRQDLAPVRIGKLGVSLKDGAEVDSDATVSAKEDTSDYSEDGRDSDATVSAGEANDEDEGDDSDSEYTEDGARKPEKGKTPPKRALSSNTTSEKPSKRVRAKGNDGGNDDRTDVHQEEEGLGIGDAEAESSEDEDEDLDDSSAGEVEDSQWRELRDFLSSGTVSSTHEGV